MKYRTILGSNSSNSKQKFTKIELAELWLVPILEIHVEDDL
jgi:hypothetical protein